MRMTSGRTVPPITRLWWRVEIIGRRGALWRCPGFGAKYGLNDCPMVAGRLGRSVTGGTSDGRQHGSAMPP
jgi:hypothetical protein